MLMISSDVMGHVDPGNNIVEYTGSGGTFEVKDSPYLLTRVSVYVSYRMTWVETTGVTVTFTGPITQSISLTIRSTSPDVKTESDSGMIMLPLGNYTVRITAGRTIDTKLTQARFDARNVDQILWGTARLALGALSVLVVYLAYKKNVNVNVKYTPPPESDYYVSG